MQSETDGTAGAGGAAGAGAAGDAEAARLAALRRSGLLDAPADEAFDRLTRLAAGLLGAPVALISLVDGDRQFFLSQQGLPEPWATRRETPLSHSFCQHVARLAEALVIEDARAHPMVCENLAIPDLNVVAYLGVPLVSADGFVLGSLCVIQDSPRRWTEAEVESLSALAATVMNEVALRREVAERVRTEAALRKSEATNRLLLGEMNHRIRNVFAIVQSVVRQSLRAAGSVEAARRAIEGRLAALSALHDLSARGADAVDLAELLERQLAPFVRDRAAVGVAGEAVAVPREAAQMVALVLHELATNAVKHGALSVEGGRVDVSWTVSGAAPATLAFRWVERGGPPVQPPSRRGFGSQLLERAARAMRGRAETSFDRGGFAYSMWLELGRHAAEADDAGAVQGPVDGDAASGAGDGAAAPAAAPRHTGGARHGAGMLARQGT